MSLVGRRPPVQTTGYPCSVAELLSSLPKSESDALRSMLSNPTWSATQIYTALEEEGLEVGRQTVARHRRGACRCGKATK